MGLIDRLDLEDGLEGLLAKGESASQITHTIFGMYGNPAGLTQAQVFAVYSNVTGRHLHNEFRKARQRAIAARPAPQPAQYTDEFSEEPMTGGQ